MKTNFTSDYYKNKVRVKQLCPNLPVTFYEVGFAISESKTIYTGHDTAGATEKYIAYNRDPRMKNLTLDLLTIMRDKFMENIPMFYFSSMGLPSKYGSWSVLEYMDQNVSTAPKYLGLQSYIDSQIGIQLIQLMLQAI